MVLNKVANRELRTWPERLVQPISLSATVSPSIEAHPAYGTKSLHWCVGNQCIVVRYNVVIWLHWMLMLQLGYLTWYSHTYVRMCVCYCDIIASVEKILMSIYARTHVHSRNNQSIATDSRAVWPCRPSSTVYSNSTLVTTVAMSLYNIVRLHLPRTQYMRTYVRMCTCCVSVSANILLWTTEWVMCVQVHTLVCGFTYFHLFLRVWVVTTL